MASLNRTSLQNLAYIRLREAKVLLDNGMYDGAYYISGYVIECALKACIAKNTKEYDFPDKKIVTDSHTHDLESLVKIASLRQKLTEKMENDSDFELNWALVKEWSEAKRYAINEGNAKGDSEDIYDAISNNESGVFEWIKQHW
ncbi:HEPN domain-containing protein [Methanomethylovorans sp.]|uniref:HEPN domain-containing protein n=1 Tax=Methanomethylovorans sp. TaxID=2758717 RepID=UPI00351CA03B